MTTPPPAKIIPHELEQHGHVRVDNYYWLNDRENPDVVSYLEEENAYTEVMTAHTADLRKTLFEEIKGRIKETDASVPYRLRDYFYYIRYEEGKEYPIHCRKKETLEADEEILLEVNEMAEGYDYFAVRGLNVSRGQDLIAFAVDKVGRRIYTIHFKNLTTGEILDDTIPDVTSNLAWANDNKTLFYAKQDPDTLRFHRIYRHVLGTDPAADVLVYEEDDETFSTYVFKSKSRQYIMIASFQTVSSEYRFIPADDPTAEARIIEPRKREHEYEVDHFGDHFYILTNDAARNFRLMKTPVEKPGREHWEEIVPHRENVYLQAFEIFKSFLVLSERRDGLLHMRIKPWSDDGEHGDEHELDFGEPAYLAYFENNPELDTDLLRYGYTSMTTPSSVYDYNMKTRQKKLLKRDEVVGEFDPEWYQTERLHAEAPDGTRVPVSLVYRKDRFEKDRSPLLIYGYGSYGASMDASFSVPRLSLLDRGFVFAIAHIRGGQELGRPWYDDGKLLKKKNTFTDFIASTEHLIARGYGDPERIYAQGGSAGGLLMGTVLNLRPELYHGVIAAVPFVDVVTTMLDDKIPLTTGEYDEWGDPHKKEYYDYILSYSPYDNVEAKDYPNLLVTTGFHDSQVQYWEPAKWVAKLRTMKTDANRLLFKIKFEAGHGGPSGRYEQFRETSFNYAFLLDLAGLAG